MTQALKLREERFVFMRTIRKIVCGLLICTIVLGFGFTASGIELESRDSENPLLFEFDLSDFIEEDVVMRQTGENINRMSPVRRTYTRDVSFSSGRITARLSIDVTYCSQRLIRLA